jgi:ligand-binding sensor domain-containing protein/signal transduction histidine kinase
MLPGASALLTLAAGLFGGMPCPAAHDIHTHPEYMIDVWTPEDGIPGNSITAIVHARDGYLWVGAFGGLSRFDGTRFTSISKGLPNNRVVSLFEDRHGDMWIGTEGSGVIRWRDGPVAQFTTATGLSDNTVYAIAEDSDGNIWVATSSGLNLIRNGRVQVFRTADGLPSDLVKSLDRGPSGRLWAGTGRGVCEIRDQRPSCNGPWTSDTRGGVNAVHEDHAGALWLGGMGDGLTRLRQAEATRFLPCPSRDPCLTGGHVNAILETRSGGLWIGYGRVGGVSRLRDGKFLHLGADAGIPPFTVRTLFEDAEGGIWIGTDGGGLVHLRPKRVSVYTTADGLPHNVVTSLAQTPDGTIWAGANCGPPSLLHDGGFLVQLQKEMHGKCAVEVAAGRDGSMWIGTWGAGLFRRKDGIVSHWGSANGLSDDTILALHEDSIGGMWVGTEHGDVNYIRAGTVRRYSAQDGAGTGRVGAFAEDREGRIWIASNGDGLSVFDRGKFRHEGPEAGMTSQQIITVFVDSRGMLWVLTADRGLLVLKEGRFLNARLATGIRESTAGHFVEDGAGNLWVATLGGISRYSRDDLTAFAAGKIGEVRPLTLDRRDGMPSPNFIVGLRVNDGRLWFGTYGGIAVIDPAQIHANPAAPRVAIEGASVDGASLRLSANSFRVAAAAKSFQFEYTALSFVDPAKVRFRYRLRNFDRDWVEAGARRTAYYSRMVPGSYRFEVMAANSESVWSSVPEWVGVVIEPFVWETAWFDALVGVCLIGGSVWAYRQFSERRNRMRLDQVRREGAIDRERVRIARDIHDDLGFRLTQIGLLAEMPPEGNGNGTRLSSAVRDAAQAMDELVWTVNSGNDTSTGFVDYAAQFAEEQLHAAAIRCRIQIAPDLPRLELTAETRRNLFLAFKESLNNVVKHADATLVRVRFFAEERSLLVEILDDGRGFAGERRSNGNGLRNMTERMAVLGGGIEIQSEPGKGARVLFRTGALRPLPAGA